MLVRNGAASNIKNKQVKFLLPCPLLRLTPEGVTLVRGGVPALTSFRGERWKFKPIKPFPLHVALVMIFHSSNRNPNQDTEYQHQE